MPEATPSPAVGLVPLSCPSCGASVPIGDSDTAVCPHCQAIVPVPAEYRSALALTRAEGAAVAQANAAWKRFKRRLLPVSYNTLYVVGSLPSLAIPLGLIAAAVITFVRPELATALPGWLTRVWLPNLILWPLIGGIYWFGISGEVLHEAMAVLAHAPGGRDDPQISPIVTDRRNADGCRAMGLLFVQGSASQSGLGGEGRFAPGVEVTGDGGCIGRRFRAAAARQEPRRRALPGGGDRRRGACRTLVLRGIVARYGWRRR